MISSLILCYIIVLVDLLVLLTHLLQILLCLEKFLWIRNNGSTLISQLINNVLFTVFAFAGTFSTSKLIMTIVSSYVIFIVTSLADTPFVYLARWMYGKGKIQKIDEA